MDFARLGLAVDSSQVERGTATLHQLTGAAGQAAAAARNLSTATTAEAAGHKAAASATQIHTAAIHANNAAMRMNNQVRTNMIYQLNDVGVSLASGMSPVMVAVQQLPQILQFGLGPALKSIGDIAGGLVTKFAPLAAIIGVVTIGIYGLTREINAMNGTNVSMADTALAVWQSMADSIYSVLGPALKWFTDGWNHEVDLFIQQTAEGVNFVIGAFVGAVEAIKAVWGQLPEALGYITYEAAQSALNQVIYLVRGVQVEINKFFRGIDSMLVGLGGKATGLGMDLAEYNLGGNPYQSAGSAVATAGDAFNNAMSHDYFGAWMGDIGNRAQQIAAARGEVEELGGAASAANDNVKKLADDGMEKLGIKAFNVAEGLRSALQGIGSGIFAAFKKGGDVAGSVLDMLIGKLEQFASSWLDNIINNGINALFGGGFNLFGGMGGGLGGTSSITGSSGGFFPGFANGTNSAPGGMAWVGEQGPELVNLPRGSQVYNNQQSMGMAANQNRPVSVQTNIINNAGVEVIENTTDDGQGGVRQEIVLNRAVANAIGKPGPSQRAVRGAGQLVRR